MTACEVKHDIGGWELATYWAPIVLAIGPSLARRPHRGQVQSAVWLAALAPLLGAVGLLLAEYLPHSAVIALSAAIGFFLHWVARKREDI